MAQILIQRDPARITNVERYEHNGNLLDWLIDTQPEAFDGLHAAISLNGRQIASTIESPLDDVDSALDIEVGAFDTVVIVLRPQGIELSLWVIVAIVAASVAIGLLLVPDIPSIDTESGSNNQLNAAQNVHGLNKAIPEIFGTVVSFPHFAQQSYYVYNADSKRIFREVMFIGVGEYDIGEWYDGDSPFSEIPGASATVYQPNDTPTGLLSVKHVPAAQNTDLLPPDQTTSTAYISSGTVTYSAVGDSYITISASTVSLINLQVGDTVNMSLYVYQYIDDSYVTISGTYTVSAISAGQVSFSDADWLDDGQIIDGSLLNNNFIVTERWYTLSGDAIEEVRFHLVMPSGIRDQEGNTATVTATLTVELLDSNGDPTGTTYSRAASFTGKTLKAQAVTFTINSDYGMTTAGRYRAKAVRLTNALPDGSSDLLQLERLESVTPYTADFGNVTSVVIDRVTPSTGGASRSSSKISAKVTRKLRVYDNSTGIYAVTPTVTRRFCDAAFYLLHELMGVDIDLIDTDALFGIHDSLSDDWLGYFDYTFDDRNISARDMLRAICNAARVVPWNDGLTWTFTRDEAKPFKSAMFNRRNLKSASHTFVQQFRRPADYDSVTIKYVDDESNSQVTVSRRIVGSSILSGVGVRPLEIDLLGCRNANQATNRADLEVRRLIYQNVTVTDTALNDALLLQKLQRVDWIDMFDGDLFDGEIVSVDGSNYVTSERFTPEDGVEYWVYVTDQDGNVSNSVRAYARDDGDIFGFKAAGLTGVYLPTGTQQLGSRYVIASNNDLDASTFVVDKRSRPNENGECEITLIEYNEQMYEMD